MRHINHQEVVHLGTFNGNPMSMRAGLVTLTQIFTPEAHAHAIGLSKQLGEGYVGIIEEFDLPMHVAQIGAKGCAMFRYERARNYRAWWEIDMDVSYAYWLFLANRGILSRRASMTSGQSQFSIHRMILTITRMFFTI